MLNYETLLIFVVGTIFAGPRPGSGRSTEETHFADPRQGSGHSTEDAQMSHIEESFPHFQPYKLWSEGSSVPSYSRIRIRWYKDKWIQWYTTSLSNVLISCEAKEVVYDGTLLQMSLIFVWFVAPAVQHQ